MCGELNCRGAVAVRVSALDVDTTLSPDEVGSNQGSSESMSLTTTEKGAVIIGSMLFFVIVIGIFIAHLVQKRGDTAVKEQGHLNPFGPHATNIYGMSPSGVAGKAQHHPSLQRPISASSDIYPGNVPPFIGASAATVQHPRHPGHQPNRPVSWRGSPPTSPMGTDGGTGFFQNVAYAQSAQEGPYGLPHNKTTFSIGGLSNYAVATEWAYDPNANRVSPQPQLPHMASESNLDQSTSQMKVMFGQLLEDDVDSYLDVEEENLTRTTHFFPHGQGSVVGGGQRSFL